MSNSLMTKLAGRKEISDRSAYRNIRINASSLEFVTEYTSTTLDCLKEIEIYLSIVKSAGDWNVGKNLWSAFNKIKNKMFIKIKREGRGVIQQTKKKNESPPNYLTIADTNLKKTNKDENQEANINTLNASTCNLPEK